MSIPQQKIAKLFEKVGFVIESFILPTDFFPIEKIAMIDDRRLIGMWGAYIYIAITLSFSCEMHSLLIIMGETSPSEI